MYTTNTLKELLSRRSPAYRPALLALSYVAVAATYIIVSDHLAAWFAIDAKHLMEIEKIKGILFVLVTGLTLFGMTYAWERQARLQNVRLVSSERRAMASLYSATIIHDLNNYLMALTGLLETLRETECGNQDLSSIREDLQSHTERLTVLSKHLARSARQWDDGEWEECDLIQQVQQVVDLIRKHPDVRNCRLEILRQTDLLVRLNPSQFEQALLNLILNAAQATGKQGHIQISCQEHKDAILLTVEDNGPGIPEHARKLILEPGYTTKSSGSGLGLLCVQAFLNHCQGTLAVEDSPLGGARLRLHFPVRPAACQPSPVT